MKCLTITALVLGLPALTCGQKTSCPPQSGVRVTYADQHSGPEEGLREADTRDDNIPPVVESAVRNALRGISDVEVVPAKKEMEHSNSRISRLTSL